MEEQKVGIHKISITERQNLQISGVVKVVSCTQTGAILKLKEGNLIISGVNLDINSFNDGNIFLNGIIDSLKYSKSNKQKESFFKRIFK